MSMPSPTPSELQRDEVRAALYTAIAWIDQGRPIWQCIGHILATPRKEPPS